MSQFNRLSSVFYGVLLALFSIAIFYTSSQIKEPSLKTVKLTSLQQQSNSDIIDDTSQPDEIIEQDSLLLQSALIQSKQGNKKQAISIYKEILLINNNHQMASVNLAVLELKLNGCTKSLPHINHAVAITRGSRLAKSLSMQGYCLAKNKQYPEAVASFNRSIEFRPNHPATWKRLAKAQEDMGVNSVTVLITMQRALSLDSKDDGWRVSIAKFQHERLDFRGSINTIKSGYSSMKKLYAAQFLLAWNYIELKKWNNARKHIQIAENLDKSKFNILKSMGFYSENLYRESIDLLKQNKKFKQIHYYLLALNYVEKGGLKTASKNFQRIDSKSKFSLKSSLNLLVANQSKLSDKEINDQFNGLIEAGAIPIYPSYLAAKILSKKKQYADAENWLKDLSFPNSIKPANNLYAHVLWMQDKRNLAIGILEKTIEKNKKNHHSIRQLSEYLYSDKKYEKALLALEDFKIADFKVQDFILKGNIYISLNQLDQAEKLFKEGIEYWSKSTSIRFDFAKLLKLQNKTEQSKQQLVLILKLDKSHAKSIKLLSEYNK